MSQQGTTEYTGVAPRDAKPIRVRSEEQIADALSRAFQAAWGQAVVFWSIPVDEERDADCILYDAFRELRAYRATFGPLVQHKAGESE